MQQSHCVHEYNTGSRKFKLVYQPDRVLFMQWQRAIWRLLKQEMVNILLDFRIWSLPDITFITLICKNICYFYACNIWLCVHVVWEHVPQHSSEAHWLHSNDTEERNVSRYTQTTCQHNIVLLHPYVWFSCLCLKVTKGNFSPTRSPKTKKQSQLSVSSGPAFNTDRSVWRM